jgi:hypothetical protein
VEYFYSRVADTFCDLIFPLHICNDDEKRGKCKVKDFMWMKSEKERMEKTQ